MSLSSTSTSVRNFRKQDSSQSPPQFRPPFTGETPTNAEQTGSKTATPSVAVLLCTHQGEQFLSEQLESIHSQDHKNLALWVSDDGSTDKTQQILSQYQNTHGKNKLSIQSGPKNGFAGNFLSLLCSNEIVADYFALSDQDDIWEPNKLSRALLKLEQVPNTHPALYCSKTRLIDKKGEELGYSPQFNAPPGFANALVQNIGGGNTMLMNKAAREILKTAGELPVVSHDWWTYMLISAVGGTVIYDPEPTIRYRQHGNNLVGSNASWRDRWYRTKMLFAGRFRQWNTKNTNALKSVENLLTPENRNTLNKFCFARNRSLLPRMVGIWQSKVYRQTFLGNLRLVIEVVFKRL